MTRYPGIGKPAKFLLLLLPAMVAGCATPPAPDLHGRWRPVNRYADEPVTIPLQQAYLFQATPMDGTLKNMLTRWSRDAKLRLAYEHPNDYTLFGPVGDIHTDNLEEALAALSSAYSTQGVAVALEPGRIVVRNASSAAAAEPAAGQGQ